MKLLSIKCEFVPFSESRNAKKDPKLSDLSLNWKITLFDSVGLTLRKIFGPFDYMQGIANCPAYKVRVNPRTDVCLMDWACIKKECETGKLWGPLKPYGNPVSAPSRSSKLKSIPEPELKDILYCLLSDGDAIEYTGFEDWAESLGYDTDSRKAETIYEICLKTSLALRVGLGDARITRLREQLEEEGY